MIMILGKNLPFFYSFHCQFQILYTLYLTKFLVVLADIYWVNVLEESYSHRSQKPLGVKGYTSLALACTVSFV